MPGELEASTRWQINVGDDSQHDRGGNTMNRRSAISMWLLLAGSAIFWQAHDATKQLVVADTGPGTGTRSYPKALNDILGTKFRVVGVSSADVPGDGTRRGAGHLREPR